MTFSKLNLFFMVKLSKITCLDLAMIKMSRALPKKFLLLDFRLGVGGIQNRVCNLHVSLDNHDVFSSMLLLGRVRLKN